MAFGANMFAPMLLVYARETGLSEAVLSGTFSVYAAGIVPGVIMCFCLGVAAYVVAVNRGYPKEAFPGFRMLVYSFAAAIPVPRVCATRNPPSRGLPGLRGCFRFARRVSRSRLWSAIRSLAGPPVKRPRMRIPRARPRRALDHAAPSMHDRRGPRPPGPRPHGPPAGGRQDDERRIHVDIPTLRARHPEHWMKAAAIRTLAMDGVQAANSGHPGMPMGMADVATVLFRDHLRFDPQAPDWPDRDRFVLSAGHGSMLLYALLYLTGYPDIGIDEIRRFRQLGSRTPGHPEIGCAAGVETTTGPLGQGLGNAVGMAMAERMMAARYGAELVDHWTYVIAGDGCLMEGISQEAITLAGHLKLNRLIVIWDDNGISIDGKVSILTLLNSQSVSNTQPDDSRLMRELHNAFGEGKHAAFSVPLTTAASQFTICHFAADVTYTVGAAEGAEGFVSKNKDSLLPKLPLLLRDGCDGSVGDGRYRCEALIKASKSKRSKLLSGSMFGVSENDGPEKRNPRMWAQSKRQAKEIMHESAASRGLPPPKLKK